MEMMTLYVLEIVCFQDTENVWHCCKKQSLLCDLPR